MGVVAFFASMFIAAGIAGTALPARADDEPPPAQDFTRDGWYLQVQGLYAVQNFDYDDAVPAVPLTTGLPEGDVTVEYLDIDFDDGAGFNILAGYRMGRNFAGELEFEFIESFDVDVTVAGQIDDSPFRIEASSVAAVRTYNVAINIRAYPLARLFDPGSAFNRLQPFVKAGPAWQWGVLRSGGEKIGSDGGFAGRFGAGLDIYITKNIVVTAGANYMLPTCDIDGLDYLSFGGGLQYRFGGGGSRY